MNEFESIVARAKQAPHPKLDYRQAPASAFLTMHFLNHLYSIQTAYMIILRTNATMYQNGFVAKQILQDGLDLSALKWVTSLREASIETKVATLLEAYITYPHPDLFFLMIDLDMEADHLDAEWARRLKDKPVASEFIRFDWENEETRLPKILHHLKVKQIQSYRPWQFDQGDLRQIALLRAIAIWRRPSESPIEPMPLPPFPVPISDMLPSERDFWEKQIAAAWEAARPAILRETLPVLSGEHERIPDRSRETLREEWKKTDRRETLMRGEEKFPDPDIDPSGFARASFDFAESAQRSRFKEIDDLAQAEKLLQPDEAAEGESERRSLYRMAQRRWGDRGKKFLDALLKEHTIEEASAQAGVSRQTGHKYLRELQKTISKNNPPN